MRDRLIELLKKTPLCNKDFDLQYSDGTIEKFADYLLENGVIVPPCKVGDKVYVVYKGGEYYWQAEVLVVWIRLDKDETDTTVTVKFKDGTIDTLHSEEIYITKEQAEQALRKEDEKNG